MCPSDLSSEALAMEDAIDGGGSPTSATAFRHGFLPRQDYNAQAGETDREAAVPSKRANNFQEAFVMDIRSAMLWLPMIGNSI